MKHMNLKKKVEKYAPVEKRGANQFVASFLNQVIEWRTEFYDETEVSLLRVRRISDKDELVSDYCAGSFYDTIKSAMREFTWDLHGGKNE